MTGKARSSLLQRLALGAGSFVVVLLLAEWVCRVRLGKFAQAQFDDQLNMRTDFYQLVDGSVRGFEIRPHATEEINSLGMRMREIRVEKPAGAYRVIVLGDSIAYGIGVKPEETMSSVLETLLRQRYPDRTIEVLNAGVISYNTEQEWDWLVHRGMPLAPDAVVVAHCPNDVHSTPIVFREGDHLRYFRQGSGRALYSPFLIEHSALYRTFLAAREISHMKESGTYRANADLKFGLLFDPDSQFASLAKLSQFATEKNLALIVCAFPYLQGPFDQYLQVDWNTERGLIKVTNELKVPLVDLLAEWKDTDYRIWKRPEAADDFVHPNAKGHAYAAKRIFDWFVATKRIGP